MPQAGAARTVAATKLPDARRLLDVIAFQSDASSGGESPEQTMQRATECAMQVTAASGAVIELADGSEMVYRVVAGSASDSLGLRLAMASSMSGLAVQTAEMQICSDSESDDRVDRDACRRAGLRSLLCVPLVHRRETVGVLKVISPRVNAFDEADAQVLRVLAGVVAAAMVQADLSQQLETLASTDALTGLLNRRAFQAEALRRLDLTRRKLVGSVVVMVDLDNFKSFNDRYGHQEGDDLLQQCAERWATALRAHDILGRWGGEEFLLLLTDCAPESASIVCERMRLLTPAGQTFSAGVAVDDLTSSLSELIARADAALYAAKRDGRNRTVVEPPASAAA